MSGEYVFRIEKRSPEHPLTPAILVELMKRNAGVQRAELFLEEVMWR